MKTIWFRRPTQKGGISEWEFAQLLRETDHAILIETIGRYWIPKSQLKKIKVPLWVKERHPFLDPKLQPDEGYELSLWFDREKGGEIFP